MRIAIAIASILVAGCAGAAQRAPLPAPSPDAVDYACRVDDDCAVKNVGNCCGYYPACVNRESATFPERVKAECARKGMKGVCGFPEISGCACVEGRCAEVREGASMR